MVRILYDDWSIWLGENRSDQILKHLAAMLLKKLFYKNGAYLLAATTFDDLHVQPRKLKFLILL